MTELRFHGKNEDGTHLSLVDHEGHEYTVRISDSLRASVNQPRLSAVSPAEEEFMSVREVQKRLRAGESAESIARDGNTSVDYVERFAGPIISERIWIINQAHEVHLRKENPREPYTFFDIVISKLAPRGVDEDSLVWRTYRRDDGRWHLELSYPTSSGSSGSFGSFGSSGSSGFGSAIWIYEAARRSITPEDDNARWMLGEDPAPRASEPGLIYSETPARTAPRVESFKEEIVEEKFEAPRLVAVREEPSESDTNDGIKGRAKVPSWDEIMFGIKPEDSQK